MALNKTTKKSINGPLQRHTIVVCNPFDKSPTTLLEGVFTLGNQVVRTKFELFHTKPLDSLLKDSRNLDLVRQHFVFLN